MILFNIVISKCDFVYIILYQNVIFFLKICLGFRSTFQGYRNCRRLYHNDAGHELCMYGIYGLLLWLVSHAVNPFVRKNQFFSFLQMSYLLCSQTWQNLSFTWWFQLLGSRHGGNLLILLRLMLELKVFSGKPFQGFFFFFWVNVFFF